MAFQQLDPKKQPVPKKAPAKKTFPSNKRRGFASLKG